MPFARIRPAALVATVVAARPVVAGVRAMRLVRLMAGVRGPAEAQI
jgi:hypothetical protein